MRRHLICIGVITVALAACTMDASTPGTEPGSLGPAPATDGPSASAQPKTLDDLAPEAPRLDPPVSPTSLDHQRVRGSAEPGATVVIRGGVEDVTTTCDETGRFEADVRLHTTIDGHAETDLIAVAVDATGNVSAEARARIVFDAALTIEAPELDMLPSPTPDRTVTLTGRAKAGAEIRITGAVDEVLTTSDAEGRFAAEVTLHADVTTELRVTAKDRITGEVSAAATLRVEHDGIAPTIHLDPVTTPTPETRIRITGRAEAHARIRVRGGVTDVVKSCDSHGHFVLDVDLHAEATTHLVISAVDLAGNASAEILLDVEHLLELEASAAASVHLEALPSVTAEADVLVRGTATPHATIEIRGGAHVVTTTCDEHGQFAASVTLHANLRNELHVEDLLGGDVAVAVIVHDGHAPAAPIATRITFDASLSLSTCPLRGALTLRGDAAVESAATVRVHNHATGLSALALATAEGDFEVGVLACAGDHLEVVAIDAVGNASAATTLIAP